MLKDQAWCSASSAHSIPKAKGSTARPECALEPHQPNLFQVQPIGGPKEWLTNKASKTEQPARLWGLGFSTF